MIGELRERREVGVGRCVGRVGATGRGDAGRLPHLAETGFSELLYNDDPEASFERGLDWLLAGAAGSLTK